MKMLKPLVSLKFAALACLLLLPSLLLANPIPDALIFIHVQPADYGAPPAITTCAEIVQYTTDEGELEFDLYMKVFAPYGEFGIQEFEVSVEWPAAWTYGGYHVPFEGISDIDVNGNGATVTCFTYPCEVNTNEVILLCRIFLDVDGVGQLEGHYPASSITLCPDPNVLEPFMVPGMAGVVCDYGFEDCDFDYLCRPHTDTHVLNLEIPMGETVSEEIMYHIYSPLTCDQTTVGTEDWMEVSVEAVSYNDYIVTLVVDTEDMDPGDYGGWVRMESDGAACTWIDLTVMPLIGLDRTSWGEIKARY